jgi:hypothetical protein
MELMSRLIYGPDSNNSDPVGYCSDEAEGGKEVLSKLVVSG